MSKACSALRDGAAASSHRREFRSPNATPRSFELSIFAPKDTQPKEKTAAVCTEPRELRLASSPIETNEGPSPHKCRDVELLRHTDSWRADVDAHLPCFGGGALSVVKPNTGRLITCCGSLAVAPNVPSVTQ